MAPFSLGRLAASWAWVGVAVMATGMLLPWLQAEDHGTETAKGETKARQAGREARTVHVEFSGQGQMQMVLEFERLELDSPYGKLAIPVAEIQSIEFATRLAPDMHKKLDEAIFRLGSVDFATREGAEKELLSLGEKAFPALLVATRHADLEVARRAQELVVRLRETLPAEKLAVREFDVVTTRHSKISGKIGVETFQVDTSAFGVQQLRLSDIYSLRSLAAEAAPVADAGPIDADPGALHGVADMVGKTFAYRVTGRADGFIWGTGVYTTDSNLATAAVHAGALKVGETAVVRVTILPPPPAFGGSTQNGVTSHPFGPYPGAYQVLVPKK